MRRIQAVLPDAIEQAEVIRTARAQVVLRYWPDVVGADMARRSYPDRFEKGVVWVAVQGSAWAQELRFMKTRILDKLNEMEGSRLFTDVRFGVRPLPSNLEYPELPVIPERVVYDESLSISEIAERRLRKWKD